MRRLPLLLALALCLLTGCSSDAGGIPEGLTWTAQVLQSQEDGAILAAASGEDGGRAVPVLDITAQVEKGEVTLTDHASGETCTGSLAPRADAAPGSQIYTLRFPDRPEGHAVYGVTKYAGGGREATLYLTVEQRTLRLTAPLPEE